MHRMAAGDTISGQIRVVRQSSIGHRRVVAGAFPTAQVDHLADLENSIYVNPPKGMPLPMGMMPKRAGKAIFSSGEIMSLEHKSASLAELATTTLSEIQVDVIEEDFIDLVATFQGDDRIDGNARRFHINEEE